MDALRFGRQNFGVIYHLRSTLWRLLTTPYSPDPEFRAWESRAETQENANAEVTVAVLDAAESADLFGVPLARRGIQPVHLRIVNRSDALLRLLLVEVDPNYYSPLEAAAACHFSILKRLSALGFVGWLFFWILPVLLLIPFKLVTAYRANRRMDDFFRAVVPFATDPAGWHERRFCIYDARRGDEGGPHFAPLDRRLARQRDRPRRAGRIARRVL